MSIFAPAWPSGGAAAFDRTTWDAPDADHGERKGPFDGVRLTGAEVGWLAERVCDPYGLVSGLHLETLYVNTL